MKDVYPMQIRSSQMKLKALAVAMAVIAGGAQAEVRFSQEVHRADSIPQPQVTHVVSYRPTTGTIFVPVVSVEPIHHMQSFSHVEHICTTVSVPMYRNTPVVSQSQGDGTLGMILGAIAGVALTKGDARVAGGIIGGAVGHAAGSAPRTHVHGYTQEFVGYRQQQSCQPQTVVYQKPVVIGYNVVYNDGDKLVTVTRSSHPGTHMRLTTTTRLE
jgi:uncharacterized protein YcfJ